MVMEKIKLKTSKRVHRIKTIHLCSVPGSVFGRFPLGEITNTLGITSEQQRDTQTNYGVTVPGPCISTRTSL